MVGIGVRVINAWRARASASSPATCGVSRPSAARPARRPAVPAAAEDHRHPGGTAELHRAPHQRAGGEEGDRGVRRRVHRGRRQGRAAREDGRRLPRRPRRDRARGDLPGRRRREEPEGPGLGDEGDQRRLRPVQAEGVQILLQQPLPGPADAAAGGARLPLLQRHAQARRRGPRPNRAAQVLHQLPAARRDRPTGGRRPTRPCSKSDVPRRPSSSPATCATATSSARSRRASTTPWIRHRVTRADATHCRELPEHPALEGAATEIDCARCGHSPRGVSSGRYFSPHGRAPRTGRSVCRRG